MVDTNKKQKNVKCLTISESKDLVSFGIKESGIVSLITLEFKPETFNKCEDFKFLNEFIFHFYLVDHFDKDLIIGVNRYEKCVQVRYDKNKKILKIKAFNKKFYNMSELKLLRKDKIGNFLIDCFDENDDNDDIK